MATQQQKILSSKKLLATQLFDVVEEKLQAKDTVYTFSTVYAKPVACVIPMTPKREIYLINQYRYLFEGYMLGIISGFIDTGESSLQAAKRELKEEGGMEAGQWELIAKVVPMRSVVKQAVHIFLARDLEISEQNLQDEEEIDVVKLPLSEAVEKVMNGEIYHSASATAILMLDKLRQQKRL